MSQLRMILQESGDSPTTIIRLLREEMDGGVGGGGRRRSFKERFRYKGIGCCGTGCAWGFRPSNMSVRDEDEDEDGDESHGVETALTSAQSRPDNGLDPECTETAPVSSGMNLAAALATERHFQATQEAERVVVGPTSNGTVSIESGGPRTPGRVSLMMRLLEETEGSDPKEEDGRGGGGAEGSDWVCCVCMGRKKGAAFIPCGHTFCRVCSREVWLNRGACPLCNRSILEILDIF